jgi:glycosyltransferase involved in cell wall biosynthesis
MAYQARAPQSFRIGLSTRELRFLRPPQSAALDAQVVVAMALRDQAEHLPKAMASVLTQLTGDIPIALLLLDDGSTDDWQLRVQELLMDERVAVLQGRCGSPAQARNALLDMAERHFPQARWVARLDADDTLADPHTLLAMVQAGDGAHASYVLGSNHLIVNGRQRADSNLADADLLLDRHGLTQFIEAFCSGKGKHELPSCNLLIRQHQGIRYPLVTSAEDHWLVTSLLMFRASDGLVQSTPVYCNYRLHGDATVANHQSARWQQSRHRLAEAASLWCAVLDSDVKVLGFGMEGVVWRTEDQVFKRFYSWSMTLDRLRDIQRLALRCPEHLVTFEIIDQNEPSLTVASPPRMLRPLPALLTTDVVREFLSALWRSQVVTSNIKRDNLRLDETDRLVYIDIGSDIYPLSVSRFLDASARLYATTILGWSDFELSRRNTPCREDEVLQGLPGFAAFYGELIAALHPVVHLPLKEATENFVHDDVTLLIKACPQDAEQFTAQVKHVVGLLTANTQFARQVLLIDPYSGPYLRQFAAGDLPRALSEASSLEHSGWVDEVWIAPQAHVWARETNDRWFDADHCDQSHTSTGAPVTSQIWAFEQVPTRYVLQMDIDVLVGQTDRTHDYLTDMKQAIYKPGVWCVGFNIPQATSDFKAYASPPQGCAPEVRLGLLDLDRIKAQRPFANPQHEGKLTLMWHRALELAQRGSDIHSVRGGDPRTFYLHPMNRDKLDPRLPNVRDLVAQGRFPAEQAGHWDLDLSLDWAYAPRDEDLIFLMFGRNTDPTRLDRCIASLHMQSRQDFGVIMIDDASETVEAHSWHLRFGALASRLTLVRRPHRHGYLSNFALAIKQLCKRTDSLLVVLDQDDALMSASVVDWLWAAWKDGADLIQAPMWRPDKPLHRYPIEHRDARSKGGGNVWAHLRAFRKSLYERIPSSELDWPIDDSDIVSDHLTMLPMSELAERPVALDLGYAYFHERNPYGAERKAREHEVLRQLFERPALS